MLKSLSNFKGMIGFFVILGALMTSSIVAAQEGGGGEGVQRKRDPGERHMRRMIEQLGLTDEQVTQLKAIHEKQREALSHKRDKAKVAQEVLSALLKTDASESELWEKYKILKTARSEMEDLRFKQVLEIRSILTPEQRLKFDGMKGKKGRRGGRGMRQRGGGEGFRERGGGQGRFRGPGGPGGGEDREDFPEEGDEE